MTIIISTENCQEAYNTKEECWYVGNEFTEEDGFDMDTVTASQSAWDDEKDYFMGLLNEVISAHEKRYGTDIVKIALAGRMGLWDGNPIGGRLIRYDENPLEKMGNVDTVEVSKEDDGTITILGRHHDGTHRMHLYLLSERMLNNINPDWDYGLTPEDFKTIYENRKPVKFKG